MTVEQPSIRASYAGAEFVETSFVDARFRNVNMTGAKIRGAYLKNVDIDGIISGLVVNGIEVEPLIEAEKLRRNPEIARLGFTSADGARDAWSLIEFTWAATTERALSLPTATLMTRVDGEWSFLETLRHLVLATDIWLGGPVLGAACAPAGLPHTEVSPEELAAWGIDRSAMPTLDEVLELRRVRLALVRRIVDSLDDSALTASCAHDAPDGGRSTVDRCLRVVVGEEWAHHEFVVRDLKTLAPDMF